MKNTNVFKSRADMFAMSVDGKIISTSCYVSEIKLSRSFGESDARHRSLHFYYFD